MGKEIDKSSLIWICQCCFRRMSIADNKCSLCFSEKPDNAKAEVIVEIRGGVCYITKKTKGVKVKVIDFDEAESSSTSEYIWDYSENTEI